MKEKRFFDWLCLIFRVTYKKSFFGWKKLLKILFWILNSWNECALPEEQKKKKRQRNLKANRMDFCWWNWWTSKSHGYTPYNEFFVVSFWRGWIKDQFLRFSNYFQTRLREEIPRCHLPSHEFMLLTSYANDFNVSKTCPST